MERSISEVAAMAGISTRTLRHYHHIGLLVPSRIGTGQRRWYARAALLRLQRILLLRDLDVPLAEIGAILEQQQDETSFLERHLASVRAERARLDELIVTLQRTITQLRGDPSSDSEATLRDEEFFVGLRDRSRQLEADLVARLSPAVSDHFAHGRRVTQAWTRADHEQAAERGRDLLHRLSAARRRGWAPSDGAVLELMAEHHAAVQEIWPADPAAYHALGEVTESVPQQRAMVAAVDPDLPRWLAEAIRAYAVHRLGHPPAMAADPQ